MEIVLLGIQLWTIVSANVGHDFVEHLLTFRERCKKARSTDEGIKYCQYTWKDTYCCHESMSRWLVSNSHLEEVWVNGFV